MSKPVQNILCVQRAQLFKRLGFGQFEGFRPVDAQALLALIADFGQFLPRTDALEHDDNIKQIIPQIALVCGDKVCIHRIPDTGSEARLIGRFPILFGGHLEEGDKDFFDGADREAGEEFRCPSVFFKQVLGVINVDEVDEVSRHHVGILIVFVAEKPEVFPTEDEGVDSSSLRFLPLDELEAQAETLTAWSREALPILRHYIGNGLFPPSPWVGTSDPEFKAVALPLEATDEPIMGTVLNGAPGEKVELPIEADRKRYRVKSTGQEVLMYCGPTYGVIKDGGVAVTAGPNTFTTPFFEVNESDLEEMPCLSPQIG